MKVWSKVDIQRKGPKKKDEIQEGKSSPTKRREGIEEWVGICLQRESPNRIRFNGEEKEKGTKLIETEEKNEEGSQLDGVEAHPE